jgi:hypothetical protein
MNNVYYINPTSMGDEEPASSAPADKKPQMDFDDLTNAITLEFTKQIGRMARKYGHDSTEVGRVAATDALIKLILRAQHPEMRAALVEDAIEKLKLLLIQPPPSDPGIVENPSTAIN